MAIVYSYPIATPEAQDLLVGTEMALQGGEDAPRTRTFTIGSIIGLAESSAAGIYATIASVNLKANITSQVFLGTPSLPPGTIGVTQAAGNSTSALATTSFVTTADNLKANIASPTFTGTLTTANDVIINSLKLGRGAGNKIRNTVFGSAALSFNTSGEFNTAVGFNALSNNTTGGSNTAIGHSTLVVSNGSANTAVGFNALEVNTSGEYNTAVGHFSLAKNQDGNRNVAVGFVALENNTSGGNNVGVGEWALNYNQTGGTNTAIGTDALYNSTTHSNSTGLGYLAQVNGSNQVQLGNQFTNTYVYGTVQDRSDLRDKAEIRDTVLGLDFINKLRPVDYKWDMREDYRANKLTRLELNATDEEKEAYKILVDEWLESNKMENLIHDGTHVRNRYHHGLIAQEVKSVIEESGVDFGGFQDHKLNGGEDVLSIGYDELIAPMIKAIQELKAEIELLKSI